MNYIRHIKRSALAISIVVVAAIVTLGVLWFFTSKDEPLVSETLTSETAKPDEELPSAQTVIDLAKKDAQPVAYAVDTKSDTVDIANLFYKKANSYATLVPTSFRIRFIQEDTNATANSQLAINTLTVFLKNQHLTLAEGRANGSIYQIFENNKTTCQLTNIPKASMAAAIELSCLPTEDIKNRYTLIDELLTVYKEAGGAELQNPTAIFAYQSVNGDVQKTILNIYRVDSGDQAVSLSFSQQNDTWRYDK